MTITTLTDKNLYAYCDSNPVIRVDNGGQLWETVLDIGSLGLSIVDVCENPDDPWAWVGLVADTVDLIPFVTGIGEISRAANTTRKISKNFDEVVETGSDIARLVENAGDLGKVGKNYNNAIDTYADLKKISAGSGNEVHHIIEKRFAKSINFGNANNMQSIILTKKDHAFFTKTWRNELPYGRTYTPTQIYNAAQKVYAGYPTLLNSVRKTLNIN